MKAIALIPARYGSSRFEGKPLADIMGQSMICRVYRQVLQCKKIDEVYVATDDERIATHVREFGGRVCMTSSTLPNGTSRCWQAYTQGVQSSTNEKDVIIVNVQGDEPFIAPEAIDAVVNSFTNEKEIVTLAKKITEAEALWDPNVVKVVKSSTGKALFFSRQALPYVRNEKEKNQWLGQACFYKHVGLYAYRAEVLKELVNLPEGALEKAECLEQLRWLENGYEIWVTETDYESLSVDVPGDIEKLNKTRMI